MSVLPPVADAPPPYEATLEHTPSRDEATVLLRGCFEAFSARLRHAARDSLDLASDLFEATTVVPEVDVDAFRAQRAAWLERFARTLQARTPGRAAAHAGTRAAAREYGAVRSPGRGRAEPRPPSSSTASGAGAGR